MHLHLHLHLYLDSHSHLPTSSCWLLGADYGLEPGGERKRKMECSFLVPLFLLTTYRVYESMPFVCASGFFLNLSDIPLFCSGSRASGLFHIFCFLFKHHWNPPAPRAWHGCLKTKKLAHRNNKSFHKIPRFIHFMRSLPRCRPLALKLLHYYASFIAKAWQLSSAFVPACASAKPYFIFRSLSISMQSWLDFKIFGRYSVPRRLLVALR